MQEALEHRCNGQYYLNINNYRSCRLTEPGLLTAIQTETLPAGDLAISLEMKAHGSTGNKIIMAQDIQSYIGLNRSETARARLTGVQKMPAIVAM